MDPVCSRGQILRQAWSAQVSAQGRLEGRGANQGACYKETVASEAHSEVFSDSCSSCVVCQKRHPLSLLHVESDLGSKGCESAEYASYIVGVIKHRLRQRDLHLYQIQHQFQNQFQQKPIRARK
jgi:hypothetical protein